ncbi:MAG: TatD family hydrolase [Desulfovibrio sp.]|nr:TatD family hydrolase [Desulfovibrio sp.]
MGHKKVVRVDPVTLALPLGGVDSHAHLGDQVFAADLDIVLQRSRTCGLAQIVNICLDPDNFTRELELFAHNPHIYFALGIHPIDGHKFSEQAFSKLEAFLTKEPRLKAVGEIGLDYYWQDCPREIQKEIFLRQLHMAKACGKPVVIHCRMAEEDCLLILESQGFANYPVLWHCFGGDLNLVKRLNALGFYISVPGAVTYKGNALVREAVKLIPEDRLLLETDCPYLAPVPMRGTRNEPAYTVFTARTVAEARGEAVEELWLRAGDNARRFFGI